MVLEIWCWNVLDGWRIMGGGWKVLDVEGGI